MKRLVLGPLVLMLLGPGQLPGAQTVQTLPAAVYRQLKRGKKLDRVWFNPNFDPATGFVVGQVDITAARGPYRDVLPQFTTFLGRIALPGSPNVLNLAVTEFVVVDRVMDDMTKATIGVEGQIVAKDGTLLMAFTTQGKSDALESISADCTSIMNRMVWNLARDLGPAFQQALMAKAANDQAKATEVASTPVPAQPKPPPPPAAQTLTPQERLFQLEELKKQGLISPEEYQARRDEIQKTP